MYLPGIPGGQDIASQLGVDYFAVPVGLGQEGAKKAYTIGSLSIYEKEMLAIAVAELKGNVKKGTDFSAA